MIFSRISQRYKKDIALLLFAVMAAELALPLRADAGGVIPFVRPVSVLPLDHLALLPAKPVNTAEKTQPKGTGEVLPQKPAGPAVVHSFYEKQEREDDIDGPGQPEMKQFTPVGTSDMVDLFSGDFSYNIPLLDVGGYPVNISYNSHLNMDQESSWVGLGWNINTGSVTRNMRGLPDDFNGKDQITQTTFTKPHTVTGGGLAGSFELGGGPLGLGVSGELFYNSKAGWGVEFGIRPSINLSKATAGSKNLGSAAVSLTLNSQEGLSINPSYDYHLNHAMEGDQGRISISTGYNSRAGLTTLSIDGKYVVSDYKEVEGAYVKADKKSRTNINHGLITFARPAVVPSIGMPYTSKSFTFTLDPGFTGLLAHFIAQLNGYYSKTQIKYADQIQVRPAFGYLHAQKGRAVSNALMDMNRDKEVIYRDKPLNHNIAVPSHTYDAFMVNGEGTGGMFRAFRSDAGATKEIYMRSKSENYSGGVDLGAGGGVKFGANLGYVRTENSTHGWNLENHAKGSLELTGDDPNNLAYEPVYLRNPAEPVMSDQAFYNKIGDEALVRLGINQTSRQSPYISLENKLVTYNNSIVETGNFSLGTSVRRDGDTREKRKQVISYLTGEEAVKAGFNGIKYYPLNVFPMKCDQDPAVKLNRVSELRKEHHISMVTVLNPDGRRYEYGIPAYNIKSKEVTYSAKKDKVMLPGNQLQSIVFDQLSNMAAKAPVPDDMMPGSKVDAYYNSQETPGYSHSFLLTSVASPDYVDITGDGVTEDDQGDAIHFNYSLAYNNYRWRTPFNPNASIKMGSTDREFDMPVMTANYERGLETDYRDDKASYAYGEKEIWYLNSVESKTMIALFDVSKREDADGQLTEAGGRNTATQLYKLDKIRLYSRADYYNNPSTCKPIKTVHFKYNYSLCKGFPLNSNAAKGKLTLEKIWFTYNANEKGELNPYIFKYTGNNQDYQYQASDNWGNYKDPSDNPGGLTNLDYPYPVNNLAQAAKSANVAPWAMNEIVLPSSSKIKVTYEADDYAFVQDKRAQQLFRVVGLGLNNTYLPNSTSMRRLYEGENESGDHLYVFVKVSTPVTSVQDVYEKYLEGNEHLYFRMHIKMPGGDAFDANPNGGLEYVKLYAKIEAGQYGTVAGYNNIIWFKVKGTQKKEVGDGNYSPFAKAAIQFLRTDLPAKAYPGSAFPPEEGLTVKNFASMVVGMGRSIMDVAKGFHQNARKSGFCKTFDITTSFVRLNQPDYKKVGGGYRVKKVEITDNWNKMTGQKESSYGQEYIYTATEEIHGVKKTISSGVASYEPVLFGEENPFRFPIESKTEQTAPLGPVNTYYVENPLLESFYPAASVGYSRVVVRSINTRASLNVKSSTGWDESCFYTARDFPIKADYTPLADGYRKFKSPLRMFVKIGVYSNNSFSQGFRVELNDMHGKPRSQASYAENNPDNPISRSDYYYKSVVVNGSERRLDNTADVVLPGGEIRTAQIGKEIELMTDFREQSSIMGAVDVTFNIHNFGVYTIPVILPMPSSDIRVYRAAAVTKIINRHALLDKVVAIDKGSEVSTQNMLYDAETGDVIATRTNNEFNDPVYNVSMPAHWAYDRMGPAYHNIDVKVTGMSCTDGTMSLPAKMKYFVPGDEVLFIPDLPGPGAPIPAASQIVWAMHTESESSFTTDPAMDLPHHFNPGVNRAYVSIKFVTREGKLFSSNGTGSFKVIRSGRRNMSGAPVGAFTTLASPIEEVSGVRRLKIENPEKVLNASAVEYREDWRVQERRWLHMIAPTTVADHKFLEPRDVTILNRRLELGGNSPNEFTIINPSNIITGTESKHYDGCNTAKHYTRTILKFDFSQIPAGASITGASLTLRPSTPVKIWTNQIWQTKTCCWFCGKTEFRDPDWTGQPNTANNLAYIYPVTNDWDPGKVTYSSSLGSGFLHTGLSATIPSTTSSSSSVISLTSLVQDHLQNPAERHGFLFASQSEAGGDAQIIQSFCKPASSSGRINNRYVTNPLGRRMFVGSETSPPEDPNGTENPPGTEGADCAQLRVDYEYINPGSTECKSQLFDRSVNPYVQGLLGNYRPYRSYTYYHEGLRTATAGIPPGTIEFNIRRDGIIANFKPFWRMAPAVYNTADATEWLLPPAETATADPTEQAAITKAAEVWSWNSENTLFDRKGMSLETKDPLNRYTAGQYGYNYSLPVAVTQNSKYRESGYEGFEDYNFINTGQCPIECPPLRHFDWTEHQALMQQDVTHTGKYALRLNGSEHTHAAVVCKLADAADAADEKEIWVKRNSANNEIKAGMGSKLPVFGPVKGKKMVISAWVKEEAPCNGAYVLNDIRVYFMNKATETTGTAEYTLTPSGLIIEGWQRYERVIDVPASGKSYMKLELNGSTGSVVYFDDIRMHPYNANMKSFVYDPVSLRLMAELDENNYASMYEYDDDGTLIRVKKETERGVKTINETRSALQKLPQ